MDKDPADDDVKPYEKTPTLTIEQAVMRLLGYEGPFEFGTGDDVVELGLDDFCEHEFERADAELSQAQYLLHQLERQQSESSNELQEAKNAVAKWKDAVEEAEKRYVRAEQLRIGINHEITKIRAGKRSLLVIDEDQSQGKDGIRISESSVAEWASSIDDQASGLPSAANKADLEAALDQGLSRVTAESTYVTLGLLVQLLVKSGPPLYRKSDEPNLSKIAKALQGLAIELNGGHAIWGQKEGAITDRLELAIVQLLANIPPPR